MPAYLIRHTTPDAAPGICYGQTDLALGPGFQAEARKVGSLLPGAVPKVYSSPLKRCLRLAEFAFPDSKVNLEPAFIECSFGDWEGRRWDDLDQDEVGAWMKDFVNARPPGGESYEDLYRRCTGRWEEIREEEFALFTHAGVIRSLLSYLTGTPLALSFERFRVPYGSVYLIGRGAPRML